VIDSIIEYVRLYDKIQTYLLLKYTES